MNFTEKILQRIRSFSVRRLPMYQEIAVPNDTSTEHFPVIFLRPESWVGRSLPDFVYVYFHFNVPPNRITNLVANVTDEKIDRNGTFALFVFLLLSSCFDKLVFIQSVV